MRAKIKLTIILLTAKPTIKGILFPAKDPTSESELKSQKIRVKYDNLFLFMF